MIAKATESHVTMTDLPELKDLMRDNIRCNFGRDDVNDANDAPADNRPEN